MYQNPFSNISPVVKNLLIINIIFFIAKYVFAASFRFNLDDYLAAYYPASPYFKPWQPITYMFMHGGLGHIFSNMLGLIFIGPILEYTFGSKRFLQYYFITGIGALLFQFIVQAIEVHSMTGAFFIPGINASNVGVYGPYLNYGAQNVENLASIYNVGLVGASGAIFGLLMAIFLLYPDMEIFIYFIPIPVKIKYFVPVYVLIELYSGLAQSTGDNVAHFAHLGGALIGFIVIKLWGYRRQNNIF